MNAVCRGLRVPSPGSFETKEGPFFLSVLVFSSNHQKQRKEEDSKKSAKSKKRQEKKNDEHK